MISPHTKYALRLKNHGGTTSNGDGGLASVKVSQFQWISRDRLYNIHTCRRNSSLCYTVTQATELRSRNKL